MKVIEAVKKKRTFEETIQREKIRALLQMANIGSMSDIQNLFKETIAEFMESGLEVELDEEPGYSKYGFSGAKSWSRSTTPRTKAPKAKEPSL